MANGKAKVYFYIITILVGLVLGAYGYIGNGFAKEIDKKADKDVVEVQQKAVIDRLDKNEKSVEKLDEKLDKILDELRRTHH